MKLVLVLFVVALPLSTVFAELPKLDMTYTFLSPLPELGTTFDPTVPNNLGTYLNAIIPVFIGVCVILAVIMIVLGGLQYMTSELISGKEAGKERIRNAIFGLLLALGAWLLLYTINPKILDVDLSGITQQDVTIQLMPESENILSAVTSDAGAPTAGCPDGIGRTDGISVCNSILSNVHNMIAAANSAGCHLSGGGYRSTAAQTQLRVQNCHGDTTNRNAACSPPTALPGASRHQQGLAIDFASSGTLIQTHDNSCFIWLNSHAGSYGLYNLSSESWHWSIDGN